MSEQANPIDVSFAVLAGTIREAEASGMTFSQYLEQLRVVEKEAIRRREIAETVAGICQATKTRKPRSDKGKPRAPKPQDQTTA